MSEPRRKNRKKRTTFGENIQQRTRTLNHRRMVTPPCRVSRTMMKATLFCQIWHFGEVQSPAGRYGILLGM